MAIQDSFDDISEWVKTHPGFVEFTCQWCGVYTASCARCSDCEGDYTKPGKMETDLIPPSQFSRWIFQVKYPNMPDQVRDTLQSLVNTPIVRRANPQWRVNAIGLIEVEFVTTNEDAVLQAWQFIEGGLK